MTGEKMHVITDTELRHYRRLRRDEWIITALREAYDAVFFQVSNATGVWQVRASMPNEQRIVELGEGPTLHAALQAACELVTAVNPLRQPGIPYPDPLTGQPEAPEPGVALRVEPE